MARTKRKAAAGLRVPPGSDSRSEVVVGDEEEGPKRTCVVTREVLPREHLLRLVVDPDGRLMEDWSGRLPVRGFYVRLTRGHLAVLVKMVRAPGQSERKPSALEQRLGRKVWLPVAEGRVEEAPPGMAPGMVEHDAPPGQAAGVAAAPPTPCRGWEEGVKMDGNLVFPVRPEGEGNLVLPVVPVAAWWPERVALGLGRRMVEGLGLARRAGALRVGLREVGESLLAGERLLVIMAVDAAENTRAKAVSLQRRYPGVVVWELLDREGLGRVCGCPVVAVLGVANEGLARRVAADAVRWRGFFLGG